MVQKSKALRVSRKLLAALLALVMVLSATPVVFAADDAAETPAAPQGHVVSASGTWCIIPDNNNGQAAVYFSADTNQDWNDSLRGVTNDLNYTYVQMSDDDVVSISFGYGTKKFGSTYTAWTNPMQMNDLAATTQWTVNSDDAGWGSDLSSIVVPNGFDVQTENYKWIGTISFPAEGEGTYQATYFNEIQTRWGLVGSPETGNGTVTINITVIDKSDLATAVSEAEALLADCGDAMTSISKSGLESALAAAQAQMGDDALDQDAINTAAAALNGAIEMVAYNPADYTNLDAALAAAADIYVAGNNGKYTEDSYNAFAAAYEAALALKTGTDARDQAAIEDAAAALADAQSKLDQIANYTLEQLGDLIDNANAFLAENRPYMTEDSIAEMEAAISAAQDVLDSADMTQVDSVYTALETLEVTYTNANYDALDEAVKAAEDFLESDEAANYESAAKEELQAAIEQAGSILREQDSRYQATINAMTETVKAAMPTDADLLRANMTELQAAVDAANAKLNEEGHEDFTIDSVNALKAQIILANGMLTNVPSILEQEKVNAQTAAVIAATEAVQLERADDTALIQAVAEAEAAYSEMLASGNYEETALEAYAQAIAAAKQVIADQPYSIREQDMVAAEVAKLTAAAPTADDLKPANVDDLNAAIAEGKAKMQEAGYSDYTAYTREVLENAVDAAEALAASNPTILQQADVNAAAQAVRSAIAGLIDAEADYSKLNSIVTTAELVLKQANLEDTYTKASIAALQAAVDAANALDKHLPGDQQSVVDAAADAVRNAYQNMQTYNKVTNVTVSLASSNNGKDEVDGNVIYHTTPWYQTWMSQSVTLKYDAGNADVASVQWVAANWSVDKPEATITNNADGTVTITPTFGIGPRSMWVKAIVTDVNGNVIESDPIKVRFINWSWQK